MQTHAWFTLRGPDGSRRAIALDKERSALGSGAPCDIRLDDPLVPLAMGVVARSMGDYFLVADDPDDPFVVNGRPCARAALAAGDIVSLGGWDLLFEQAASRPAPADLESELLELAALAPFSAVASPGRSSAPAEPAVAWGLLIPRGREGEAIALRSALCMIDLGRGQAMLSSRHGKCFATLASGIVFCGKERLGPSPKAVEDGSLIASGTNLFVLRLNRAP